MNQKTLNTAITLMLCLTVLLFLGVEIILNLTPPISRDALIHHLAVPKHWLRQGGFSETPWAEYSYYPMYVNLLYLICLFFKSDVAPKFIHLGFGLATGGLVYVYLKHNYDRMWGLLGLVVFFTTPIVVWLCTSAYIDLGMTFFTTGSLLAFVKWRDEKYKHDKWVFISAVSMGIAIGSKYNALIAFLFLNLTLMFCYVRDTKRQMMAVKYGVLFLAVAAIVASPWYVKNYLLTDNPFYPLFNSFFQSLHQHPVHEALHLKAIQESSQVSFFRIREIMYGETFWETLLIPIRMFFQGEDNSYRYFQGVLNPILIVFWPFILLDKKNIKDKVVFTCFCVLFVFAAYFLTRKQVRYLLPVLPFLAILAVMGIAELADKLKPETSFTFLKSGSGIGLTGRIVLFASVALLLGLNGLYLKNRVDFIKPFACAFGRESREDFLRRHLKHFPAVEYANTHLPDDAVVLTMFLGRRGYYLDRSYKNEPSFGMVTLRQLVSNSVDAEKFVKYVRSLNVTHILMRTDLVARYLESTFSHQENVRFMNAAKSNWKLSYEHNGYAIWDIQPQR